MHQEEEKRAGSLPEQTAQRIIAYIRAQKLQPGDRLPSEIALMRQLGVGRNTLREAQRALASRNILHIRQGAGTFLAERPGVADDPLGLQFMSDGMRLARDLMQVRIMVEPPIAALAAQNATGAEIDALEGWCEAVEARMDAGEDFTREDQRFHEQLARCSHNQVVGSLVPIIHQGVVAFSLEHERTETLTRMTRLTHRRILRAVRERRAADAQQDMLYHLRYNDSRRALRETGDADAVSGR